MKKQPLKLFLAGDVMTGRGIDQIMPVPSKPRLYESCVIDARDYIALAERKAGPIPGKVAGDYIWGDALAELDRFNPDVRIVNLETSVTTAGKPWPGKGIHYRMHPDNLACLLAARLDVCGLANNHVLDWGREGLAETLKVLRGAGLLTPGAGLDEVEAQSPAAFRLPGGGRLLVLACGLASSGIAEDWAAGPGRSGVFLLPGLDNRSVKAIARILEQARQPGDRVLVSIHWGGNWGYYVEDEERLFAHRLIEEAGADVIHGHSSHHPRGIEVWHGRLILYGCGDLINDYEGIRGYEGFRPELSLLYLPTIDADTGLLERLQMVPMRMERFRLNHTTEEEAAWLQCRLNEVFRDSGTALDKAPDGSFELVW
ncbi:CapA family protein [Marinobacter sp.]|uniref:CapA family protein n=1 Tax=Marinobacter sp. TaxID=50741 RepID=UPI00356980DB